MYDPTPTDRLSQIHVLNLYDVAVCGHKLIRVRVITRVVSEVMVSLLVQIDMHTSKV